MFYDAQLIVYNKMESSFYADFVVSHDYTQFVCQSESAMDEIRKQLNVNEVEEQLPDLDWSDGLNFKERVRKWNFCLRVLRCFLNILFHFTRR